MQLSRRAFAALALAGAARSQSTGVDEQVVFASGQGGYHTFRIPALLVTQKGTLLAFCEARKLGRGDSGEIDMVVKRSEDGGRSWSEPQLVWGDGANTCGNPCPVVDRKTGRILLPMTWNRGEDGGKELHQGSAKGTRRVFLSASDDDGKSWAEPREITSEAKAPDWWWYATGPGVSIQIQKGAHAGRIVVPANHTSQKDGFAAHTIYSDDGGKTWRRSNPIAPACNESQVVELSDGRLMMNMRSQSFTNKERNGYRAIAFSDDGGAHWTPPELDAHLGDPQVQASLIRYSWPDEPAGNVLLFANPSPPVSPERGKRVRMTVRLSRDDGKTWPAERVIHEGPSAYSSLARLPDGSIGLLYEGGAQQAYENIRLARFSLDWLAGGA
ncbi:MAG: exo-alpha-sialidase [Acidobacteria bacterium]|nr:exo-alpha-sialidase [Acidobacteriota bacterium]